MGVKPKPNSSCAEDAVPLAMHVTSPEAANGPGVARLRLIPRAVADCGTPGTVMWDSWAASPPPSSGTFHPPDLDRAYLPSLRASSLRCVSKTWPLSMN
jgi:hypothetical protein